LFTPPRLEVVVELPFLTAEVLQWILAAATAVGITILLDLVRRLIIRRTERLAQRTSNYIDDILLDVARKTKFWFIFVIGMGIGMTMITLSPKAGRVVGIVFSVLTALQVGLWATALLEGIVNRWLAHEPRAGVSRNTMGAVRLLGRIGIWSILLLVVLDNSGVNITTLVAGLGIGGVAVALATQNILGDLFSSLSIVLDKPFEVGDAIVVDEYSGAVEHIGLKTTRVRATSGEQLIFSNSNLLGSRIRNYRRMLERRIELNIAVEYDTRPEQLPLIVDLLKQLIGAQPVRMERVHFTGFGDIGLTFQAIYHMPTPDYTQFMDVQQAIALGIVEGLKQLGVDMAAKPGRVDTRTSGGPERPVAAPIADPEEQPARHR
jgi:small-conductance mechanosensitive channel